MSELLLLTGAGFSRNWGGWLANEAFEYLLSCPLHPIARQALWDGYDSQGGFEMALVTVPDFARPELSAAVEGMFKAMNASLLTSVSGPDFGVRNSPRALAEFLGRFDAIFTLNQDLLFEHRYQSPPASNPRRWDEWEAPGTKVVEAAKSGKAAWRAPVSEGEFRLRSNFQPYFKLHGSSHFRADERSDAPLLIMGGNKASSISGSPLLAWYHREFQERLLKGARVMIIGYSFGDEHINRVLVQAAREANTTFFVVDPFGVDVIDRRPPRGGPMIRALRNSIDLLAALSPKIVGASRRTLRETFGGDDVELGKLLRFVS
jgi:hypothetical protein